MCGFFVSNNPLVRDHHLDLINRTLEFRGPDCSSGLVKHGDWVAYHSRLSIINPESGVNQPIKDHTGGMLVFNGEILNYKEIGIKYFGIHFESDTKLLSELISSNLLNLLELDGFFSFVYISKSGKVETAVRDRFGVKPLFVHQNDGFISFCSEPNTLKKLFGEGVNVNAVEEYRCVRAPIFEGSFFTNIKSIEPGHCFIKGKYFDCLDMLNESYVSVSNSELKNAILTGIDTRKVADANIGLLLSRGIDSNLLKEIGDFDKFYSIGFEGDEDIEYLKSQKIPDLTLITCTPNEYLKNFRHLLELRGEPMSVPNEVLLYNVSKEAASDGIKVLLSGEGADEFFGGYDRIFQWAYKTEHFLLDTFLDLYCYESPDKSSLMYKRFEVLFSEIEFTSAFEYVRWFFIRYHMPVLFRRLDFALMAAGIEGREPIANHHVFELAAKISPTALMGEVLGKLPLRELVSNYKGKSFGFEKKVGFPVDLTRVFDNPKNLTSYELWFEENLKVLK